MAVTHHGYNVLKIPGNCDIITISYEEKDTVCSLERTFQAASIEDLDNKSGNLPEAAPKKKRTSPGPRPQEAGTSRGVASGSAPVQGAPPSVA